MINYGAIGSSALVASVKYSVAFSKIGRACLQSNAVGQQTISSNPSTSTLGHRIVIQYNRTNLTTLYAQLWQNSNTDAWTAYFIAVGY